MNVISNINFIDFYFNGHYLSEFGGIVGGLERLSNYPLLPSRVYITDRAMNQDGETVFSSYLEPRTFEVPIFFEDIDLIGLRKIAGWLNTKSDEWFYFRDDDLKIKCALDSGGTMLETLMGGDGGVSLKFIAHDPYYYELDETQYEHDGLTGTVNSFVHINTGNEVAFPLIRLWASGTATFDIYDSSMNLYRSCTVTGLTSGVELDTRYRTCLTISGAQLFNNFTGDFPVLPVGQYTIIVTGNSVSLDIYPNLRFV